MRLGHVSIALFVRFAPVMPCLSKRGTSDPEPTSSRPFRPRVAVFDPWEYDTSIVFSLFLYHLIKVVVAPQAHVACWGRNRRFDVFWVAGGYFAIVTAVPQAFVPDKAVLTRRSRVTLSMRALKRTCRVAKRSAKSSRPPRFRDGLRVLRSAWRHSSSEQVGSPHPHRPCQVCSNVSLCLPSYSSGTLVSLPPMNTPHCRGRGTNR